MKSYLAAKEKELKIEGEEVFLSVGGLDDSHSREMEAGLTEGDVTWEELKTGERNESHRGGAKLFFSELSGAGGRYFRACLF